MKKLLLAVVALVMMVGAGAYFLGSNLDSILKKAIQKYGSEATQAHVTLSSIKLTLTDGKGALNGLTISNPAGFSSANAFYLGQIAIQVDPKSLASDGPIVINSISIDKPQITYEVTNSGTNNLMTISDNAKAYIADKTKAISKVTDSAPAAAPAKSEAKSEGRKIAIRDLSITGGQVSVSHELLKTPLTAGMPNIHMTNIGGDKGASAEQITQLLISMATSQASQVGANALMQQIPALKDLGDVKKLGDTVKGKIQDQVKDKVGTQLNGLLKF